MVFMAKQHWLSWRLQSYQPACCKNQVLHFITISIITQLLVLTHQLYNSASIFIYPVEAEKIIDLFRIKPGVCCTLLLDLHITLNYLCFT